MPFDHGRGNHKPFRTWAVPGMERLKFHCRSRSPHSIDALKRHGIDPGRPYSNSWNEFPGQPTKLHWSTPDSAKVNGDEADIEAAFDRALLMLKEHIEKLVDTIDPARAAGR